MDNLQTNSMPGIVDKAPDFELIPITGQVKFCKYIKGSWLILFSHPADFIPLATTKSNGFKLEKDFFVKFNTKLMGLSTGSFHSHIAWVNSMHEKLVVQLEFPIVADISKRVTKYNEMLQPGRETTAVRALFIIDPEGKVRVIMYYALSVGKNMEEIKRMLVALQTSDDNKCALLFNGQPGEKVIVPAPKTVERRAERKASNLEMVDWYLSKKSL